MSVLSVAVTRNGRPQDLEAVMKRPEVPFPKHWFYYIAIKFVVLAGAVALALRLYDVW
jgi:hypothetical protein